MNNDFNMTAHNRRLKALGQYSFLEKSEDTTYVNML